MVLELKIIVGLLLHFVGDYLLQNDWMAQNKTKNSFVAFIHAFIYSLSFLLVVPSIDGIVNIAWFFILVSHFFIDRFRLAIYWIRLVNWNWKGNNFGYNDGKPAWMAFWLMVIIDNTLHVIINTIAIIFNFYYGN